MYTSLNNMHTEPSPPESADGESGQGADKGTFQDERPRKMPRVGLKDDVSGPSCFSCRKKKTKCSRGQPCNNCSKMGVECNYDEVKTKSGLRTGAVESLSQRVSALENMFVGQGIVWQQMWKSITRKDGFSFAGSRPSPQSSSLHGQSSSVKESFTALGLSKLMPGGSTQNQDGNASNSAMGQVLERPLLQRSPPGFPEMPPDDIVDSLVEIYFRIVHPWIPMLHVRKFRALLSTPVRRATVTTILQAIVSLCIRFSIDPRLQKDPSLRLWYATRCQQAVILQSMEAFSVQNIQALVICAFDTIGSGRGPSAWSIVGSMARTVEQLRLSKEEDETSGQTPSVKSLMRRMVFLPPCADWQEAEERRRVFWNVFLMDRFCSISTGWNLSLTSADVHRRLPCDETIWEESEHLQTSTPFFGILDQSQPRQDCLPTVDVDNEEEKTSLDGFAFCIEATESLRLVTSFFLRHEVDFTKAHDVQKWLMRFKQLDLRLARWNVFLPEKCREACSVNAEGNLDPNLILAHMTHNTAVVLLHQGLAYPSPEWTSISEKLPSASSVETCQAAAAEVSRIATEFLQASPILTSPQFAFCLFVCGRILLTHEVYLKRPILPEFDSIVQSLDEISKRWNGAHMPLGFNLASKFTSRLLQARRSGVQGPINIHEEAFSEEKNNPPFRGGLEDSAGDSRFSYRGDLQPSDNGNLQTSFYQNAECSPDSVSMAFPPLLRSFQNTFMYPSNPLQHESELSLHKQDVGLIHPTNSSFSSNCTAYLDAQSFPH